MAQPSTPSGDNGQQLFGSAQDVNHLSAGPAMTPSSATSSNNTFLMPNSPIKGRQTIDGYRPKVTRTLGQRPACLVNATVTYCGNNVIYAFGGFDAYTDEVYNHVLKLDMVSHQWSLGMSPLASNKLYHVNYFKGLN
jgi:Kelch motif